jgi:hypothetical protein
LIDQFLRLLIIVYALVKLLHDEADARHNLVQMAVILVLLQSYLQDIVRLLEVRSLTQDVCQLIQACHDIIFVALF